MKIAVCLKLAPSSTAVIRVAASGAGLEMAGVEMLPSVYDEFALEQALRVREKNPGSEITALTVGGPEASKVLTQAFSLEVEQGLHVSLPDCDARAAARCAAAALKPLAPDLIFCGRQAIDDDQWLFPAALAEYLGLPHVTAASQFELSADGKHAQCRRRVEGGEEVLEVALPAVVSCDKGLNEPRSPTLKGRMNAKKKQPVLKTPAELGLEAQALAPALTPASYAPPPSKSQGQVITKPPAEAAAELVRWLRQEAKVI